MGQLDLFGHEVLTEQKVDIEKKIFDVFSPVEKPKTKTLKQGYFIRTASTIYTFLEKRLGLFHVMDDWHECWIKQDEIILCGSTLVDSLYKGDRLVVRDYDGQIVNATFEQKMTQKGKTTGFCATKQSGQIIVCHLNDLVHIAKLKKIESFVFVV